MKTLGIIGGLGPMATALLLERIVEMTDAQSDQAHLDVILFNRPDVPDRTEYILDHSKASPVTSLIHTAKTLEQLGAAYLGFPCVTSHAFFEEIGAAVSVPLINMVTETAECLRAAGMKKTGIMATTGTIRSELFQKALGKLDIEAIAPGSDTQRLVMTLIYKQVKAGKPADMKLFDAIARALFAGGCDSIILGCTELCVIGKQAPARPGFISVLDVLAARGITLCGKPVKSAYSALIQRR